MVTPKLGGFGTEIVKIPGVPGVKVVVTQDGVVGVTTFTFNAPPYTSYWIKFGALLLSHNGRVCVASSKPKAPVPPDTIP